MTNMDRKLVKRIFVKVSGLSDEERDALITMFHLSESRRVSYALWTPEAPHAAEIAVIDGDSWEATLELANPEQDRLKLIWVGEQAPTRAALVLARPLDWAATMEGMDTLLPPTALMDTAPGADLDFDLDIAAESADALDLDLGFDETTSPAPLDTLPPEEYTAHALVIDPDMDARLYLRAKLAGAGFVQMDEAASASEALQRMNVRHYKLVMLNLELPDMDGWQLARLIRQSTPAIDELIVMGNRIGLLGGLRARLGGASACLRKPLQPARLQALLKKAR